MKQEKYIMFAILLLLVGVLIYLGFKKFSQSEDLAEVSTIIDSGKAVASSGGNNIDGKRVFLSKCASCHHLMKDMVGPALMGLRDRGDWSNAKRLYQYIRDPEFLSKDKYIAGLRKKYGVKHMGFPDLSDEEIKAMLNYVGYGY